MSRILQSRRLLLLLPSRHLFSTSSSTRSAFATGPAPPRLPPKEQEEFELLQRSSTGAFSTPRPSVTATVTVNQSSSSSSAEAPSRSPPRINQVPAASQSEGKSPVSAEEVEIAAVNARIQATGEGEELHPDIRRGAKPEFEGDINPKTGEVGGPKNDPLRWGSTGERGDWSYNGRVTDF